MEHPHDMPSSFMATSIHEAGKAKVINPSAVSVNKAAAAAPPPPPPGAAAAVAAATASATATAGNASNVGFAGANINLGLAGGISGAEPPIALVRGSDNDNGNDSNNNGLSRSNNNGMSRGGPPHPLLDDHVRLPSSMDLKLQRKPVKYRECLKNHAANLGGHATDGCGEFMPSGEEGSIEALRCAACNCHRNFHRREVEGEPAPCDCVYGPFRDGKRLESLFPSPLPLPSPTLLHHPRPTIPGSGMPPPPQMIMAFNSQPHPDSDEYDGALISPHSSLKKRFRTKFTTEQKEQMHTFAEKVGWRIQKQDEATVQQFCADIGVKRHVLKVWMHNNKHTLGKKAPGCLTMSEDEMRSS